MASGGEIRNVIKTAFKFRRIPDKWKDYAACGKPIPGEGLISFKTPLSEEYHFNGKHPEEDSLQKDEQFTPQDLRTTIRKQGYRLGLVVDFTNTKRYYNSGDITSGNIEYQKIKCEGRIVPPEKVVKRFKATILSYFKRHPASKSLIGVHCTHGLNRTGYVVCRYLIDCKGYKPDDAIEAFNKARGYDMERENYIEDLKQRSPTVLSDEDIDALLKTTPFSDQEEEKPPPREQRQVKSRRNISEDQYRGPVRPGRRQEYRHEAHPYHRSYRRDEDRQRKNGGWNEHNSRDHRDRSGNYYRNNRETQNEYEHPYEEHPMENGESRWYHDREHHWENSKRGRKRRYFDDHRRDDHRRDDHRRDDHRRACQTYDDDGYYR